ncbi:MAG: NADH-quinone oxidoreductase subunit NuoH [candidate division Zixibacteria bacterium]|nr:NADH-quinone oxidoreductase subunit NuoH [candidate division Zixibacteria bacterium]
MGDLTYIAIIIAKVTAIFIAVISGCAYATWLERKLLGRLQQRMGPTYVGPFGLLQPLADGLKLLFKEDLVISKSERVIFAISPIIAFIPGFMAFAVIPIGPPIELFGYTIPLAVSDLNIGILFILATTSLGVYGIALGGWASGSKYSLLGAIRSSAQMVSYEVSYGLALVPILMMAGTLSLHEMVSQQAGGWLGIGNWYVFKNPIAFLIFWICAIAETNRAPFDMPEAESELVSGYLTEYSSMKFSMFFVGEYANMLTAAAVMATVFFGGWNGPIASGPWWLVIKVIFFMVMYIWIRASFPRIRYDQLMDLGWKVLFPIALLNVLVTGLLMYLV